MKTTTMKIVAALVAALVLSLTARAQWITQRINLKAGWNAIHLKVNPAVTDCATVFSSANIDEVTWWNRDRISDGTSSAVVDSYNWYRDPSRAEACTFGHVVGDQRYLVHATSIVQLDVIGTPAIPKGTIYLGESNLVGVNVNNLASPGGETTYYEYFMPFYYRTPSWYEVSTNNTPVRLSNGAKITDTSKAVWLDAVGNGMTGVATFTGPFLLTLGNSDKTVNWTDDPTLARTITVKNISSEARVLRFERNSSLPPPAGHGTCVGDVQLLRETIDWSGGYANYVYVPMNFPFTTNLAAGASFDLRLKPDTSRMAAAAGDYMSVLVISDKGSTIADELRPDGTCLYRVGVCARGSLMSDAVSSAAGLWVGTVVLGEVNRAKMLSRDDAVDGQWDSTRMLDAPHPFQFRLLVHVDGSRNAKILNEVFTVKANPEAETCLLTDRDTALAFRARYPNGTIRRSASANFPFMPPLALTGGTFMEGGDTLTATIAQPYDDKTNPFVHSFHPQHDNLAFNNQRPSKLGSGDEGTGEYESWGVTRMVSLTFESEDSAGAASPEAWNRTITGGVYEETVHGLTGVGKPIVTRGVFRLTKVNDVSALTTGVIP